MPSRDCAQTRSTPERRARLRMIARVTAVSIVASELITVALMELLIGAFLVEGMLIALICSAPISAWIADRESRMRHTITEQRDRLSELNTQLNARNADLDAFARTVAHDLKNPLAAIVGWAEALGEDPRLSLIHDGRGSVDAIVESGNRAVAMVEGLLVLHGVRHRPQPLTVVDSAFAVDEALEMVHRDIARSGAIVTRSGAFPQVRAHGSWLTQVWVNLISNAVKYGGTPPRIELTGGVAADGMVRFEVRDNGEGIPRDDRNRIFGEYQRIDTKGIDGHGLGLAIVERVVRRLGGVVAVDAALTGGSVFWFTVPPADDTPNGAVAPLIGVAPSTE